MERDPSMNWKSNRFAQATMIRRVRLNPVEQRLANLDAALHTIGVTLWQTDEHLCLSDSIGMVVAESYHGRHVGEFYRAVYGLADDDSQPVEAHVDALSGESVTLSCSHWGTQFLMMIEPRRDPSGHIVGTVGLALRVGNAI